MFKKLLSFVFASDEDYEEDEILENEEVVFEPKTKSNPTRKEVLVNEEVVTENPKVLIDLEPKQVEQNQAKEDYRSYRKEQPKVERPSRASRHDDKEFITQPIISPIFGTSASKEISKKDVDLNNLDEARNKGTSATKIISPMFGINKQELASEIHVKELDIISIPKNEKVKTVSNVDKTEQFSLFDLKEEEKAYATNKSQIMDVVNAQLSDITTKKSTSDFSFAFDANEEADGTRAFSLNELGEE